MPPATSGENPARLRSGQATAPNVTVVATPLPEKVDLLSRIEDHQPAKRETLDHRPKFPDSLPLEETFRVAVPEALDHRK